MADVILFPGPRPKPAAAADDGACGWPMANWLAYYERNIREAKAALTPDYAEIPFSDGMAGKPGMVEIPRERYQRLMKCETIIARMRIW